MAKFITLDNLATFKTKLETLFAKQSAITKAAVGLDNVTNDAQVKRSEMGVANGVATLDTSGKVPSSQLPAYVDDVLEYDNKTKFPATGEAGKIYVAKDTNLTYRWSGTAYIEISPSLAIGTTSSTAAAGNHNHDSVYYKKTDTVDHAASADIATSAASAANDGEGLNISGNYYKKTDTVANATKATQDGDGKVISTTYYKKTDTVAKATEAVKATQDANGNDIATTYANQKAYSYVHIKNLDRTALDPVENTNYGASTPTNTFYIDLGDGLYAVNKKENLINRPVISVKSATTDEINALFA